MQDTNVIPPAVPLDICLQRIQNISVDAEPAVGIACKILQSIIQNPQQDKYRSVNAGKVLPRLLLEGDLALWYTLRHAGFYKKEDRLICDSSTDMSQIETVLKRLQEVNLSLPIEKPQAPPTPANTSSVNAIDSTTMSDDLPPPSHDTITTSSPQYQHETPQGLENETSMSSEAPQEPPSTTSPVSENPASPTPSDSTSPSGAKKKISEMTPEERKEYVLSLRRQKQGK